MDYALLEIGMPWLQSSSEVEDLGVKLSEKFVVHPLEMRLSGESETE